VRCAFPHVSPYVRCHDDVTVLACALCSVPSLALSPPRRCLVAAAVRAAHVVQRLLRLIIERCFDESALPEHRFLVPGCDDQSLLLKSDVGPRHPYGGDISLGLKAWHIRDMPVCVCVRETDDSFRVLMKRGTMNK
jgi:hypothetical protein